MKKTTQKNLSERLAQYGALTLAIAGLNESNGQIVYSGPENIGGSGVFANIDFNSDTHKDFQIGHLSSLNAVVAVKYYNSDSNGFFGIKKINSSGVNYYPFALNEGEIISMAMHVDSNVNSNPGAWQVTGLQNLNWGSCDKSYSQWCGATDKYLGLRFRVYNGPGLEDDKIYFGWARLDIDNDAGNSGNWLLKDWAYNSTDTDGNGVGDPILAGQTTLLSVGDHSLNDIIIMSSNRNIKLFNLSNQTNYTLYNMSGQEVLKGATDNRDYVIETPSLASGVYIVELADSNSEGIIRKKVVLQ